MSNESESTESNGDPNPIDYEKEVMTFRHESHLTNEATEHFKRDALRKCNDLHTQLLDCYEKKYFCGKVEKQFWDCYRIERGFKRTKLSAWLYKYHHKVDPPKEYSEKQEPLD